VAYALIIQRSILYEEQAKAMQKVEQRIRQAVKEYETGLPAGAAMFAPAAPLERDDD
jgi:hypothetical protein